MEDKNIDKNIEDKNIEDKNIEDKNIEDKNIDKNIEDKNIDKNIDLNINTLFGCDNLYKLQRELNPQSLYKYNYIVLDSKNRDLVLSNSKKMKWLHMNDSLFASGTVNTAGEPIRDIVGLRIYPCRFNRNVSNVFVYDNLYTVLIEEFNSQSYLLHQNRKCHFFLRRTLGFGASSVSPSVDGTELKPINNGYYWFKEPITDFNSITISIGNPHVLIDIPVAILSLPSNRFSNTSPTVITCDNSTGFSSGDTVIISGFTTDDPVSDVAVINAINDISGHTITIVDSNKFSIAVDSTSITPYTTGFNLVVIRNESINCIIPLEIISLKSMD
jgi:hypothetical protein